MTMPVENLLAELRFKDGLIPVVIVEADGQVLVLCYMDADALRKTLETGQVHVYRRSQGRVMPKGETSGHVQRLEEVRVDCEGNSLMMVVRQHVAACHAGYRSCYYRRYRQESDSLEVCEKRPFDPSDVYGADA
jgi:phosphoribosyl-AMP cyclohydrolase